LVSVRLAPLCFERKASLYAEPLENAHGSYLCGYFTVKNAWAALTRRYRELADTDLFLCFLRSYFFEDLGLVAHLLDPDTGDIGMINAVGGYLNDRIADLFDPHKIFDIQAFEARLTSNKAGSNSATLANTPLDQLFNLGTDGALWNLGESRLRQILVDLEHDRDEAGEAVSQLARTQCWWLAKRDLICVGMLDGHLTIAKGRFNFEVKGTRFLTGFVRPEAPQEFDSSGSVEIFYSYERLLLVTCVSANGTPVRAIFSPGLSQEQMDEFF